MADRSQKLAIIVTAQDLASGKLGKVRAELAQMGPSGRLAALGLGATMKVAQTGEKALGNLKNRITQLAGPLGFIGLAVAGGSAVGMLEQGVTKAEDMALAVEKLTGVTGLNAHTASQLVAVTEKYGLATDKVTTIAAFAEKTLGKLEVATAKTTTAGKSAALPQLELTKAKRVANGESVKTIDKLIGEQKARDQLTAAMANAADGSTKLAALEKTYGIVLTDNKGHAVDFATELNRVADYYNSNHTEAEKAALAATLFGKGYVQLIPILKLGSKGIAEVAAAADALGITLKSAQDVSNVKAFIAAQRDAKEAVGGLEMQLGLLAMPDLTAGLKGFTTFLATHRTDVESFFKSSLHGAEEFAGFITGSVVPTIAGLASSAKGFWDGIPAPLRDFLFKGIVADRTINFLFGMSPIHMVVGLAEGALSKGLGSILGGFAQRGSSPANPMFVSGGLGGGGLPGVAPAAETAGAGALATLGGIVSAVAAPIAAVVAVAIAAKLQQDNVDTQGAGLLDQTRGFAKTATDAQLASAIDGVRKQLAGMQFNTYGSKQITTDVVNALIAEQSQRAIGGPHLNPQGGVSNQYGPRTQLGINAQGGVGTTQYGPWTSVAEALKANTAALGKNTSAFKPPDSATAQATYLKARQAMGFTGTGPSDIAHDKSITNRLTFLQAPSGHKASGIVAEADALTTHFERTQIPLYQSSQNLNRTLTALKADQKYFASHHDTTDARLIGINIARLQAELGRRTASAAAAAKAAQEAAARKIAQAQALAGQAVAGAIMRQDVKTNITVNTTVTLASRAITSATAVDQIRAHAGNGGA